MEPLPASGPRWADVSISASIAGFVAVLVGFTSSVAIVFEAARGLGASTAEISSWMWALGMGMGLGSLLLSLWWKKPVMIAWSTPGAAVLATAAAGGTFTLPQAVGAFLVCAALITLFGVTGWFEKLMGRIPLPIASALLAGVLARFGLDAFGALKTSLGLVLSMLATYLLGRRLWPRYAVPGVLLVGTLVAAFQGRLHLDGVALTFTTPVFVAPAWNLAAIVSLGLPLFVVTMASQNLPGVAAIRHAGYALPISKIITWTGLSTLLLAPFGAFALNLAAITAAITMGREAHEDPDRRYVAAASCGAIYVVVGIFGATVTGVLTAFPRELVVAIAGLALLGSIGGGLATALTDDAHREAALITFLVTLSGVSLAGIGSAFWGVVAGSLALAVQRFRWPARGAALGALVWALGAPAGAHAAEAPIVYTLNVPEPATHRLDVEARVPTGGERSITLRWARWTPGFYRIEDYVSQVEALAARSLEGRPLELHSEPGAPHRWVVATAGSAEIVVRYRLRADSVSVTTNWVGAERGVINPAATFPTLADGRLRPHQIRLALPAEWGDAATALATVPDAPAGERRWTAVDYDQLVDSPIVAGELARNAVEIGGRHFELVDVSPPATWDGARAMSQLGRMIEANGRIWGDLPFKRYLFLNVFRKGRGGLEHRDSTLLTADEEAVATPAGYRRWLSFVSHEFVHAYNVKRLRPVELGPFDYEREPHTPSLWISEGLTTYVASLALVRAGVLSQEEFLAEWSHLIADLQGQEGRLLQTLEQSSLEVWSNSLSGVNAAPTTVSYYVKGAVAGLLLDAHLRRVTDGRHSLDDLLRMAYQRYGGERGFTPEEFRALAREIAGQDLDPWFRAVVSSTAELDYREFLTWYGLRFATEPKEPWRLEIDPAASVTQRVRFGALVTP